MGKDSALYSLMNYVEQSKKIMAEFKRRDLPIVVSLFPQVFSNLPTDDLLKGQYLVSYLIPAMLREYLAYKMMLLESAGNSLDEIPPTYIIEFAVLHLLCKFMLLYDKYLGGALTSFSDIVKVIAESDPQTLLKNAVKVKPIRVSGILEEGKVVGEEEEDDNGAQRSVCVEIGEEGAPKKGRFRRKRRSRKNPKTGKTER